MVQPLRKSDAKMVSMRQSEFHMLDSNLRESIVSSVVQKPSTTKQRLERLKEAYDQFKND